MSKREARAEGPAEEPGTKVVFLTQWMGERQISGIGGRLINALTDGGMHVECQTGPPLDLDDNSLPPGYAWWRETADGALGVQVRRFPFYPGHSSSALDRIALYGSFSTSSTLLGQRQLRQADVALVYASPATAAAAAMVARRLSGTPYVLMVQDVWPDSIFASGFLTRGRIQRTAESLTTRFVAASYRSAAAITTLSPGMKDLLVSRGVPENKVTVIFNWASEELHEVPLRIPLRRHDEPLHLMYSGNLGPPQGLDAVLRTLTRFAPGEVRLSLAGGGVGEVDLQALAGSSPGLDVQFLGRLGHEDLRRAQEAAHLHLISLRDDPLFEITLPSKTQALLCAGAPVLSFAPGEVPRVVEDSGAGIAARPGSEQSLEAALRMALGWPPERFVEMGAAGRRAYFQTMSREVNSARLVEIVRGAARPVEQGRRRRPRRSKAARAGDPAITA